MALNTTIFIGCSHLEDKPRSNIKWKFKELKNDWKKRYLMWFLRLSYCVNMIPELWLCQIMPALPTLGSYRSDSGLLATPSHSTNLHCQPGSLLSLVHYHGSSVWLPPTYKHLAARKEDQRVNWPMGLLLFCINGQSHDRWPAAKNTWCHHHY
jgi:hypothetical protein